MHLKTLIALTCAVCCSAALAQDFPTRAITLVVPAPPGGATDAIARAMALEMSKNLKQPVIIDNKAGATGMIGAQAVARAQPDGYTLLVTNASPIYYAPYVFAKVPYDVKRDFAFISEIASASLVFVAGKDVPAKNMKEFVAWAGQNKGKISYGSYGAGSPSHLANAYLNASHDLDMNHVSYKGEAPMIQDVLGGQVPVAIGTVGTIVPHIASGRLHALAVLGPKRLADLPGVPTMAEAGFSDPAYTPLGGVAMLAPAGTPAPVLARLEKEARAAVETAQLKGRFQVYGLVPVGSSAADFRRNFDASASMIQKLIKVSGLKPE